MPRRPRRNTFGTVIATGTSTQPAFAIRWWEGSKRRQRSGFKSRREATEGLSRVQTMLGDGVLADKRRSAIGFDKAADEWLKLHSKGNLRSHDDNVERYRKHVAPFFKDTPLSAITAARILELRGKLQRKTRVIGKGEHAEVRPMAARTVNLVMALVRSILRFAVINGHIPFSPTDRIGRGKLMLPVDKAKMAPPIESEASVGRVLATIRQIGEETHRPGLYGLFATLAYTGIRRGEACGLLWSDVDLERRLITVRRSYAGRTKSGKDRVVPIPLSLVTILEEHKLADPWKSRLVFPNEEGEMLSPDARLRNVLWEACDRCGLPRIRVHDLRHVYASYYVKNNGSIFMLQRILGHSTPQITSDTYAHLAPSFLAKEADRVSFPVPGPTAKVIPIQSDGRATGAEG